MGGMASTTQTRLLDSTLTLLSTNIYPTHTKPLISSLAFPLPFTLYPRHLHLWGQKENVSFPIV